MSLVNIDKAHRTGRSEAAVPNPPRWPPDPLADRTLTALGLAAGTKVPSLLVGTFAVCGALTNGLIIRPARA